MKSYTSNLQIAAETYKIPVEELSDIWTYGKDTTIAPNVDIGSVLNTNESIFFLIDGVVREFIIGSDNIEHTLTIIQGPAVIAPFFNNTNRHNHTLVISQSLTEITGRIWYQKFMPRQTIQNPVFLKSAINTMVRAVKIKVQKDIRRHACTAQERYELFTKEYPGTVNRIPLKYIASYLNMTPETVSRIRNNLSKR